MRLLAIYVLVIVLFAWKRFWLLLLWIVASPLFTNLITIRNDNPFFGSYRIVDYDGYFAGPDKHFIELLNFNRIVLGLLFLATVRRNSRPADPAVAGLQRWLGIFTLVVLFSALLSNDVLNALRRGIDSFGLCYAAFVIGKVYLAEDHSWRKFVNAFLGLGVLLGITCFVEYRLFGEWNLAKYGDAHRVCGPFRYWETLGMLVSMATFVVWFKWVTVTGRRAWLRKAAYLLLGALLAWCVFRTQTRTIMLALAVGAALLLFRARGELMSKALVARLALVLLLAGGALLVAPELLTKTRFYQSTLSRDATSGSRKETYIAAMRMFLSNPLYGIGLKNFEEEMRHYVSAKEVAYSSVEGSSCHSSYLVIAAECGLLGLVPFGFVIWCAVQLWLRFQRLGVLFEDRAWGVAMLGMTATFLLCGTTFDPFFDPTMQNHLFYMSLGCMAGRLEQLARLAVS